MMRRGRKPENFYGEGSYYWGDAEHTVLRHEIYYRSPIDQKTHRLTVRGADKKECDERMEERKRAANKEIRKAFAHSVENRNITLENALLDWLQRRKLNKRKATTVDRIERTILNQISPYAIGKKRVRDITAPDIECHLAFLQFQARNSRTGECGYSYSSVMKAYHLRGQARLMM